MRLFLQAQALTLTTPKGERGVFTIARIQAQNKVYMVMPNFTDVGIAGMHYLNSELHRLRDEVAAVGEGSARFQQLMDDMIDKKIKLGASPTLSQPHFP